MSASKKISLADLAKEGRVVKGREEENLVARRREYIEEFVTNEAVEAISKAAKDGRNWITLTIRDSSGVLNHARDGFVKEEFLGRLQVCFVEPFVITQLNRTYDHDVDCYDGWECSLAW